MQFSVVIITKNEEANIGRLLSGLKNCTDDIVILDSFSTDRTLEIAKQFNTRVIESDWLGYSATKNKANQLAKYDWVLSLDADEVPNDELLQTLLNLKLEKENIVYEIKRNTIWKGKLLKYGVFFTERKIRLFNRKFAKWDNSAVHEGLTFKKNISQKIKLKGILLHYSYKSVEHAKETHLNYAKLMANQKYEEGKKVNIFSAYFHAGFDWIKNVFIKLAFLDGPKGIEYCNLNAWYVFKKYKFLLELYSK